MSGSQGQEINGVGARVRDVVRLAALLELREPSCGLVRTISRARHS